MCMCVFVCVFVCVFPSEVMTVAFYLLKLTMAVDNISYTNGCCETLSVVICKCWMERYIINYISSN